MSFTHDVLHAITCDVPDYLEMQTFITSEMEHLVDQGVPYHSYQEYIFNMLFPTDVYDKHYLLFEPSVSLHVVAEYLVCSGRNISAFPWIFVYHPSQTALVVVWSREHKQSDHGANESLVMVAGFCSMHMPSSQTQFLVQLLWLHSFEGVRSKTLNIYRSWSCFIHGWVSALRLLYSREVVRNICYVVVNTAVNLFIFKKV